jgi:hypothetical protein
VLASKIGPDAAELAERQARSFNVLRAETIARIDASIAGAPQNLAGLLDKARSALKKTADEVFDHLGEVGDALESLKNVLNSKELAASSSRHFLEAALQDCRKALEGITK